MFWPISAVIVEVSSEGVDLIFVDGINDLPGQELRLLAEAHLARRRNKPACSFDTLRISPLASSMDIVRTGGSVRGGALGGGGVRVMIVSFSMGRAPFQYYRRWLFLRQWQPLPHQLPEQRHAPSIREGSKN